ncbi:MAG: four helix bundle protein [Candidatus Acidiferrales bacterium]
MIQDFTELKAWQEAHKLTLAVYKTTRDFPRQERYGVVSQLQRAASSVPANIAEGFARNPTNELLRSLSIARGSLAETRYFLLLSRDLGYLNGSALQQMQRQCESVAQLISGLAQSLRQRALDKAQGTKHKARLST